MKFSSILFIVLLIHLSVVSLCNCKPQAREADEHSNTRIRDNEVRDIVEDLTNIIDNLDLKQFVGDTVLKQYVDPLNDYTSYKFPLDGKNGPSLYERNSNDQDKEAIVLFPSEDKISIRPNKKTYIGLKSTGADADDREYYVFYIYLRLA